MSKQNQAITNLLEKYLNQKNIPISQIYDMIVKKLNVPRPTVRRVAKDLRESYQAKLEILSQNKNNKTWKKLEPKEEKNWYD